MCARDARGWHSGESTSACIRITGRTRRIACARPNCPPALLPLGVLSSAEGTHRACPSHAHVDVCTEMSVWRRFPAPAVAALPVARALRSAPPAVGSSARVGCAARRHLSPPCVRRPIPHPPTALVSRRYPRAILNPTCCDVGGPRVRRACTRPASPLPHADCDAAVHPQPHQLQTQVQTPRPLLQVHREEPRDTCWMGLTAAAPGCPRQREPLG